jgi:hypothetical protein
MATTKTDIKLAEFKKDLDYLKCGIDEIKADFKNVKSENISRVEFNLVNGQQNDRIKKVENLVFGAIGLTMTTIGKMILDFFLKGR